MNKLKTKGKYEMLMDAVPVAYRNMLHMNEYMLVISPNEELAEKVRKTRLAFAEKYDSKSTIYQRPHIMLVNFYSWDMQEEKIRQRIKNISMGTAPFKVELKDFGSFPSHSIYINVATKIPVTNLVKELKDIQRLMKVDPDHDPYFVSEPYITVARKLLPWQYEKGWLEYSNRHFTGRFIADSILLLKRRAGTRSWQIADRYQFENLPVNSKQGMLFAA
jgi:2'-5' RNA ligase